MAFGVGVATTTGSGVGGGSKGIESGVGTGCGVDCVTTGAPADGRVVGGGETSATGVPVPGLLKKVRHAQYPPAPRTRSAAIPMPA